MIITGVHISRLDPSTHPNLHKILVSLVCNVFVTILDSFTEQLKIVDWQTNRASPDSLFCDYSRYSTSVNSKLVVP